MTLVECDSALWCTNRGFCFHAKPHEWRNAPFGCEHHGLVCERADARKARGEAPL